MLLPYIFLIKRNHQCTRSGQVEKVKNRFIRLLESNGLHFVTKICSVIFVKGIIV